MVLSPRTVTNAKTEEPVRAKVEELRWARRPTFHPKAMHHGHPPVCEPP